MKTFLTQKYVNKLAYDVVGCAIEIHKHLGPGLLESVYETCMVDELERIGISVRRQVYLPVHYKGKDLGSILKLDLLVSDVLIVELKAVEQMIPLHRAQLLSYLHLSGLPKGLLINFNCENITNQLVPLVTDVFAKLEKG